MFKVTLDSSAIRGAVLLVRIWPESDLMAHKKELLLSTNPPKRRKAPPGGVTDGVGVIVGIWVGAAVLDGRAVGVLDGEGVVVGGGDTLSQADKAIQQPPTRNEIGIFLPEHR